VLGYERVCLHTFQSRQCFSIATFNQGTYASMLFIKYYSLNLPFLDVLKIYFYYFKLGVENTKMKRIKPSGAQFKQHTENLSKKFMLNYVKSHNKETSDTSNSGGIFIKGDSGDRKRWTIICWN